MSNGEPTCDPVWMKLLLCSKESSAISIASAEMGEFVSREDQRELIRIMEKFEEEMSIYLNKYTEGWETYKLRDNHEYP